MSSFDSWPLQLRYPLPGPARAAPSALGRGVPARRRAAPGPPPARAQPLGARQRAGAPLLPPVVCLGVARVDPYMRSLCLTVGRKGLLVRWLGYMSCARSAWVALSACCGCRRCSPRRTASRRWCARPARTACAMPGRRPCRWGPPEVRGRQGPCAAARQAHCLYMACVGPAREGADADIGFSSLEPQHTDSAELCVQPSPVQPCALQEAPGFQPFRATMAATVEAAVQQALHCIP